MTLAPDAQVNAPFQDVDQATETNDEVLPYVIVEHKGLSLVTINGYHWKEDRLQLCYLLDSEETQWMEFQDTKIDHPCKTT
eukprot:2033849-Ditylum_brightwellii.AAC.1